jgi:hypothetical protein
MAAETVFLDQIPGVGRDRDASRVILGFHPSIGTTAREHAAMRTKSKTNQRQRNAAVAPLVLILLIPLLAMVAFSVDTGYVCVVKAELQNAADSAALAGASQLLLPRVGNNYTDATLINAAKTAARAEAQAYAKLNFGGSTALQLLSSDITFSNNASTGLVSNVLDSTATASKSLNANNGDDDSGDGVVSSLLSGAAELPDSVQVVLRRDDNANRPLSLFFAPILGVKSWSGTASATAYVNASSAPITGFLGWDGGPNGLLLPITFSVDTWNTFLKTGASPDGKTYDNFEVSLPKSGTPPASTVKSTASGDETPELNGVYPDKKMPGNFGLIRLDPTATPNEPNASRWILNGPTHQELSNFGPNGLQAAVDSPMDVPVGTGLKSSLVPDFEAIIGQPRVVPLFSKYNGNGSKAKYTIVGFAGVTVVKATGRGSNIDISFQPVVVIDPTATTGSSKSNISKFVYAESPLTLIR